MKRQPITTSLVYVGVAVMFFSFSAFLLISLQDVTIGNNNTTRNDIDEINEALDNSGIAVDVSNQFYTLTVTNHVSNYTRLSGDTYQVNYTYQLTNPYDGEIEITNGVSYFLQNQKLATVEKIDIFTTNNTFELSTEFDGKLVNTLIAEPFVLDAGEKVEFTVVAEVMYMPDSQPIRNVIEFTGNGAFVPQSFASSPGSFPAGNQLFSGSGVGLFYPGITLGEQKTDIKPVSFP